VADGRVYFGDENGTVYAIGQDDTIKTLEVAIDIKPGGNPNSINLKKKGVLPVAVLTTADFDALDVDPATVRLGDPALSGTASPVKSNHGDADNDGDVDLLLFFKVPQLVANGALDENSTEALLTGETYTGVTVVGSDSVRIVPPKAFEQTGTPFECPASAAGTASPGGPSSDMTLLAMAALTLAVAAAGCRRWNWRVAPRRN